jgi:hypothetical protein
MKTEGILRKIKKLELTSGFLAILAPIIAALIGADNKMLVMLLICGVGRLNRALARIPQFVLGDVPLR